MCLGIPGRIIKINKDKSAEVDFGGIQRIVQMDLLPSARVGEYIIVHAGFAIQKLQKESAENTLITLKNALNN